MQRKGVPKWGALAVFLSVLLWGWVRGTVGVFLAVPLAMALMNSLDARPSTRAVAILLGPEVAEKPGGEEETSVAGGAVD